MGDAGVRFHAFAAPAKTGPAFTFTP